jgi:hypothetical protein
MSSYLNIYLVISVMKIWGKLKNLDLMNKIYLYSDYRRNLNQIKKRNNLTLLAKFGSIDLFTHDEVPKKKSEKIKMNFPDFEKELNDIKQSIQKKRIKLFKSYISYVIQKLNIKHFLDIRNTQNNLKHLFTILSKNIEVYKRSIQELVEGQREVTMNKKFRFEDNETVQDKMDKFEEKLKDNLSIKQHIKNKDRFI